jgi:hypothetical protein
MDRDPRAEELNNLRLAMATFAVQLDAFEARVKGGPLRIGTKPKIADPPPDIDLGINRGRHEECPPKVLRS